MEYNNSHRQYQQIPDQYNLKPVGYADTTSLGGYSDGSYRPVSSQYAGGEDLQRVNTQDQTIKYRIRILRIVSRVLAVIISGATVAPLAATLVKYFQTMNQIITVNGQQRTAWASGTVAWYTYLFFGVSTVSFVLNSAILISYCWSVKKANKASTFSSVWSGILIVSHILVWAVSVAIYRYGKIPQNGRSTDLWGWTCSSAANEIQSQVKVINYAEYCKMQVSNNGLEKKHNHAAIFLLFCADFIVLHRHCTSGHESPHREYLLDDVPAHAVEEASPESIRSREPVRGTLSTVNTETRNFFERYSASFYFTYVPSVLYRLLKFGSYSIYCYSIPNRRHCLP